MLCSQLRLSLFEFFVGSELSQRCLRQLDMIADDHDGTYRHLYIRLPTPLAAKRVSYETARKGSHNENVAPVGFDGNKITVHPQSLHLLG